MIRQSEEHDSGWGMAVYERADGGQPQLVRFAEAAHGDAQFVKATERRGRIFNAHVRRATMGGLSLENTHPFCLGKYSFCHNGTVLDYPRLLGPGVAPAGGRHRLRAHLQPPDVRVRPRATRSPPCGGWRRPPSTAGPSPASTSCSPTASASTRTGSGIFELHWLSRPGQLLVASEKVTDEAVAHGRPGRAARPRPERHRGAARGAPARRRDRGPRRHPEVRGGPRPAWDGARRVRRAAGGADRRQRGRVTRRFALLVNPASAGGRAARCPARGTGRARPPWRPAPDRRDAQPRARRRGGRRGRRAGRDGRGARRRRPRRPIAGALAEHGRGARHHPRRPRQRLRARARDPERPRARRPASRSRATSAAGRGERRRHAVRRHREPRASTPTPTGSPTRRSSIKGDARLPLRRAARARRLEARELQGDGRRRAPRGHRLLGRRRQLEGLRRRHVRCSPTPSWTTACSTS